MLNRTRVSIAVLNVGAVLLTLGGLYDLLTVSIPELWSGVLGQSATNLPPQVARLLLALLRALGGALVAIGLGTLVLINGPFRRGDRWAAVAIVLLVVVAEANNAIQMWTTGATYYWVTLVYVVLVLAGVALAYFPTPAFNMSRSGK